MNHYDRHAWEAAGMDADPLPARWTRIIGWGLVLAVGLIFWAVVLTLLIRFFWH